MLIKPEDQKNMLISGVFIFFLCIVAAVSIFFLGSKNSLFTSKIDLFTHAHNAQNLKTGAAVQLKGIRVGTIKEIIFEKHDLIKINLGVETRYQKWIKKDSYVAFKTQGVLGDRFLEILGGTEETGFIEDGDFLNVQETSGLDAFINKGDDLLTVAGRVLRKVDALLQPIDNNNISNILVNLESSTRNISNMTKHVDGKTMRSMVDNISKTSTNLRKTTNMFSEIAKQVNHGPGTVHSLIYDPSVHDDLKSLLGGSQRNNILKYFIRETIKKAETP